MRRVVFILIRLTGLPFLFREVFQKNKITIILFHNPNAETSEMIFSEIEKKYNIISLKNYLDTIKSKQTLPEKSIIITFDDGHAGNYQMLQVLKKKPTPITIFLCSDIVNTSKPFWFLLPENKMNVEKLKRIPNKEREKYFENIKPCTHALSANEIEEMKPFVDFQSHTCTHPILPMCTYEESGHELKESKSILEQKFSLEVYAISYPNGDYSEREIELAKKTGYHCGITVDFGFNTLESDLFRLKRLSLNDDLSVAELIVKASGVWAFFKTFGGAKQPYGYFSLQQIK